MCDWMLYYKEGKQLNSSEKFEQAQKLLEAALDGCPDGDSTLACEIVFEIGRSFFGRGRRGAGIGNMLKAVKMGHEEEHTENMMRCLVNEYGMPVQKDSLSDDRAAFTAIHVMRYLYSKKSGKFGTHAERDMIMELVGDAWGDFKERIDLCGLKTMQKISKFREYVIFFPTFNVPESIESDGEHIIYADFGGDLCSCGSGLPYMWCCGRIKSVDELENGVF
ncbi:MAG: hypothetical protein PQJ61_08010 [Spirochaetales bacterium]|uniref:Uncharacterized protein n=1 Tax=Candidatus Thalassospirochaeta sargassi TaxID=3119039 RepID=A0AAJ1IG46_9SPIO|nr:hypothetical protein [Spirochaetales bacterium]